MRPLEESEIQQVFEKLFKFVGKNLKNIVDRADQPHCFRLHKKVRASRTRASRRGRPRSRVRALAESPRTSRESSSPQDPPARVHFSSDGFDRPRPPPPPIRDPPAALANDGDEEISALPNGFGR